MKIALIITAAGRSERFGSADKLAQDLGGRPLLIRTVEAFTKHEAVTWIGVAGPPDPPDAYQEFKNRYGPTLGFHGACVIEGGRVARWETVQNALAHVPSDCTHIAVHDAARPGVSQELLNRLFEAAQSVQAVVPGLPVAATVKRVETDAIDVAGHEDDALADSILGEAGRVSIEARRVVETLDRTGLMEIQTPQVFEADLLRRAYAQERLDGATDDASLVERLGEPVHAVEGEMSNFKVTTPGDLKLMRAVLGVKAPAQRPVHKRF